MRMAISSATTAPKEFAIVAAPPTREPSTLELCVLTESSPLISAKRTPPKPLRMSAEPDTLDTSTWPFVLAIATSPRKLRHGRDRKNSQRFRAAAIGDGDSPVGAIVTPFEIMRATVTLANRFRMLAAPVIPLVPPRFSSFLSHHIACIFLQD